MRVLALSSQKGGSGKTTLSGHLAVQAQRAGYGPVCLIDIDPQARSPIGGTSARTKCPPSPRPRSRGSAPISRCSASRASARRRRHAAGDHHGDPVRHPGRRADRHPDPSEPARSARRRRHRRSVRARRQAADLRRQRRHPQGQDHLRSRGRAVAARHRRPGHPPPPHRFRRLDDRRPHGDGGRSQRPLREGGRRALGLYRRPARKEFPPHRLLRARRRSRIRSRSVPRPASAGA